MPGRTPDQQKADVEEAVRAAERGFMIKNDYYNGTNLAYPVQPPRLAVLRQRSHRGQCVCRSGSADQCKDRCWPFGGARQAVTFT